jgi:hypothetical protein
MKTLTFPSIKKGLDFQINPIIFFSYRARLSRIPHLALFISDPSSPPAALLDNFHHEGRQP